MAIGGILARNTDSTVTQTGPGTAGDVLTSNGAGAVPTFQTPGSGPVASAFPLVISSDFAVSAGTGVVVPESFEVNPGIIFEVGAGARVEVTGDASPQIGQLVAYLTHSPASQTIYSTTSTTVAAVDTTNLRISFIATTPKVLVRLTAYGDLSASANVYIWTLLSGASLVSGSGGFGPRIQGGSFSVATVVSGLTIGTTYTWDWAHAVTGGSTGRIFAGPGVTSTTITSSMSGQAVMEVWSA